MVLKKSTLLNRPEFSIICPKCTRSCKINPAEVDTSDRLLKIFGMKGLYIYQCTCGERCNVKLDFRHTPRHTSEISSFYTTLTKSTDLKQFGDIDNRQYKSTINSVIKNISVDGIGFIINGHHDIKPDDELLVKFTLKRSGKDHLTEKRVIVRTVSGHHIGAEFFPTDKKDPAIGFYLMDD